MLGKKVQNRSHTRKLQTKHLCLWNFAKKMLVFEISGENWCYRLFQITQQVKFLLTYMLLFILYSDTALNKHRNGNRWIGRNGPFAWLPKSPDMTLLHSFFFMGIHENTCLFNTCAIRGWSIGKNCCGFWLYLTVNSKSGTLFFIQQWPLRLQVE